MDKIFEDDGAVIIKTYCFESGLWYLAKALGDQLKEQGHIVYYVPKSKYQMMSASFRRTYPEPHNAADFEGEDILRMTSEQTINEQLHKYIVKYDIKYLISFETLMEKGNWITLLKRRFRDDLKIIDVPMAEWVGERFMGARSYRMFDEVWALNKLTADLFKNEDNVRKISWPVVDSSLFNKRGRKRKKTPVNYLHIASTNPDYSSKNTAEVIKAFDQFIRRDSPECHLHIQGKLPENLIISIEKHGNISNTDTIVSREELAKLYKQSDCIIAPSSREGLSLALYEGLASGCKVITTDAEPMNYIDTPYLCKVTRKRRDRSLVPLAIIDENSLYKNIKRVYEDITNE